MFACAPPQSADRRHIADMWTGACRVCHRDSPTARREGMNVDSRSSRAHQGRDMSKERPQYGPLPTEGFQAQFRCYVLGTSRYCAQEQGCILRYRSFGGTLPRPRLPNDEARHHLFWTNRLRLDPHVRLISLHSLDCEDRDGSPRD
jgi:hypothetical protein